jgi:Zn-dependent protease with chaperone function
MRLILVALILLTMTVLAERTKLKPATNVDPQKDIILGRDAAKDAEKELVLVTTRDATDYVSLLGNTIVANAPNENKFPFTFKIVNDRAINAFALPGGPVYINRGAIEAADNEAQLAGIIGHEVAHVLLRHGMAMSIKAESAQGFLGVLGGVLGTNSSGKTAGAVGALGANSYLLHNSREAETQADLMGAQILYDNGYDPFAMALFFDKLAKDHQDSKTEQWFSDHPIPENRITKVSEESKKMGPALFNPRRDTEAFRRVKKLLIAMPDPVKPDTAKPTPAISTGPLLPAPAIPSTKVSDFQTTGLQLRFPENWRASVQGTNITIAPSGGVNDKGNLGYGMIIDVFRPTTTGNLDQATAQLMDGLRMGNPDIKVVRAKIQAQLGGQPAQLNELSNTSPFGGPETDLVYSVLKPDGKLQFFVQVVPSRDLPQYQSTFRAVLDSVRFR